MMSAAQSVSCRSFGACVDVKAQLKCKECTCTEVQQLQKTCVKNESVHGKGKHYCLGQKKIRDNSLFLRIEIDVQNRLIQRRFILLENVITGVQTDELWKCRQVRKNPFLFIQTHRIRHMRSHLFTRQETTDNFVCTCSPVQTL